MIHQTAIISNRAKIGTNVTIGPFSIIHDNVIIGDNTLIGSNCEIGIPTELAKEQKLFIGHSSCIRSHSTFYIGSNIGERFITGHYCTIRENTLIGKGCQLGNRGDIQGDCTIGNYSKFHADVHIGKKSAIGSFVWLFPEVLLTNDPTPPSDNLLGVTIGDYAVLAAKVIVLPGVFIGEDTLISASSLVKEDVPKNKLASGNPAKLLCDASILRVHGNPKNKAYPWRRHFHRGYPENIIKTWLEEFPNQ